jgi:hypothetical protein
METPGAEAFHAATLRDPLFSAEGMDIGNASRALDDIETTLHMLEGAYGANSFARRLFLVRYPLARYAIPVSFLRSFLVSEGNRREYVADPSDDNARKLLQAWRGTSRELSRDISRYRVLHRILLDLESDARTFVMQDSFGYLSSYRHIDGLLKKLARNAEVLTEQVREREVLFAACHSGLQPASGVHETIRPLEEGQMTSWHSQLHAAEIAGGVTPFRHADIVETYGPFRYELSHFDAGPSEHTFMFYLLRNKRTGVRSIWVARVDAFEFSDQWKPAAKLDGVTRAKYAAGIGLAPEEMPYWYEPATHLYGTRDQRYWMDIATAIDLQRRPELDYRLLVAQKSSMFDAILGECAVDLRIFVNHIERRTRAGASGSYSMLYDLLSRSFPSVAYLTFNKSVWRLKEPAQFLGDGFAGIDPAKQLSEKEAQAKLTPEILTKVMSVQRLREERGRAGGWLT